MPLKYKVDLLIRVPIFIAIFLELVSFVKFHSIEYIKIVENAWDVGIRDKEEEEVPDQSIIVQRKDFICLLITTP